MAHFVKIDENNKVVETIVVNNSDCGDVEFPESEQIGQVFLASIGLEGNWKQTSYNSSFRKNFAGFGYSYDETRNAFISDKPHNSWILNEETGKWETPIEYPTDGKLYKWNEEIINWIEVITE
jgi:hypothetical protein